MSYMIDADIDSNEEFLSNGKWHVLMVLSAGHALHVHIFVCKWSISGTSFGSLEFPKLTYCSSVNLRAGINNVALHSIAADLPVCFHAISVNGSTEGASVNSNIHDEGDPQPVVSTWQIPFRTCGLNCRVTLHREA